MVTERIAESVYLFTSEEYAQVNAGAVIGPEWSVLIDTLASPQETRQIRDFVERRLGSPVRYVVNTHYHADHTLGTCLFPGAIVISHALCREFLDTRGRDALARARDQNRDLRDMEVVLPQAVFDEGGLSLRVGRRVLQLLPLAGHSRDGIGVLVLEDRVLFSGDAMMPIPYLVDGDLDEMLESLKRLPRLKLENLIQGHGEVVLRGEIQNAVRSNLTYLSHLAREVRRAARRKSPAEYLREIDVEECGKSRILLNGLAADLHARNVAWLYQRWYGDPG
jgi:glyoxylase-like metal-dependent hydrolase (beta-lactamase superfamily II)